MAASLNAAESIKLNIATNQGHRLGMRTKSRFVDDKLFDQKLPLNFNFVDDVPTDDSNNQFIGDDGVKGFSKALEMAEDPNKLEKVAKAVEQEKEKSVQIEKALEEKQKQEEEKPNMTPMLFGKQVMVQSGTGSTSKDISDIVAVGSDDYNDYISTGMLNNVLYPEQNKPEEDMEMSKDEIKKAMANMTPRQRKAMYHTNDDTDMPQHDDSTVEKTDSAPFGFGIRNLFNTHSGFTHALDDADKETAPKPVKQWWQDENSYPVTLSHNDVVRQGWDQYYREHDIPTANMTWNGTHYEKNESFDQPEVEAALQLANEA